MDLDWLIHKFRTYEIASADGTAIAAVSAMKDLALKKGVKTQKSLLDFLRNASNGLRNARQSSAALHNCLDVIDDAANTAYIQKMKLKDMRDYVAKACDVTISKIADAKMHIAAIGSKRIRSGDRLLTLCRSTTVLSILKEVANQNKEIEVFVTESRPDLEGRQMATEIAALGIPVTLTTDFAARIFLSDLDLLLAGGEAIAANGAIVSKVGTATLAELCHEARVRVLIALGSYKFSRETIVGRLIPLEEGDPNRIVKRSEVPSNVVVRNPLFDVTGPEHIDALITELGIIPPQGAYFLLNERKPLSETDSSMTP